MHTEPEIQSNDENSIELKGEIEFRNVSFVYPESGIHALQNVSFKVMPGESLAILGKTGSGKSTVANLMVRMYDATSGKILFDGNAVESISLTALRHNIGYVPQDVFLFSDTIGNNIAFGNGKGLNVISENEIHQAAKDAVIYENIMEFDKKFETLIGERGITLSGGQKQRVSIARALIKRPKTLRVKPALKA